MSWKPAPIVMGPGEGPEDAAVAQQVEVWRRAHTLREAWMEEKWAKLPPIFKALYEEHEEVTSMTEQEVQAFLVENKIQISRIGGDENDTSSSVLPKPTPEFRHVFHNHLNLMQIVAEQIFERPTALQAQAWPILLQGRDLVGLAKDGSGKTLCYILAGILSVENQPTPAEGRSGPLFLVLAPNGEMVARIERMVKEYTSDGTEVLSICDDGNRQEQTEACRNNNPHIVIATPQRLADLVEDDKLDITSVCYAALDGGDLMTNYELCYLARRLLLYTRPERTLALMGTRLSADMASFARDEMVNPTYVTVGDVPSPAEPQGEGPVNGVWVSIAPAP